MPRADGAAAPRVGVIVPVYGRGPFLPETLDGVLGQTPAPAEVVVVDDGSPEPVVLPSAYSARVRLIRVQHGGLAHARAAGVKALDTELVAFCDEDDVWEPGSLALRVQALLDHPAATVCFGRAVVVGPYGAPTGERWDTIAPGLHSGPDFTRRLFEANPIPASSALIRRPALQSMIDSGLSRAEDWDLWLKLAARGDGFVYQPSALVRYRRHPAALTAQVTAMARAQLLVHERHRGLVDADTQRRVKARDLTALAHGLIRDGDYGEARRTLAVARSLATPSRRDKALALVLRVPVIRWCLGRRDPYR